MPDRDWRKDWEMCEKAKLVKWYGWTNITTFLPPALVAFVIECRDALPYWLNQVRKLEQALHLAYRALTEGMDDVPAGERNPACAELRRQAKRAIREVMRWEEDAE